MERTLTASEIKNIVKYWDKFTYYEEVLSTINTRLCQIVIDDLSECNYESSEDDSVNFERRKWAILKKSETMSKFKYFFIEYQKYLNKIGLKLCDPSQGEKIFKLVNHGVVIV